jgi:hypothetical protein
LDVGMSAKKLKILAFCFLLVGLTALLWHVFRLPQEAAARDGAPQLTIKGGPGETPATAVVIAGAPSYVAVVAGEYQFLRKRFGQQGKDWRLLKKEVYQDRDKVYDLFIIEIPKKGAKEMIYFDITKYFKKR